MDLLEVEAILDVWYGFVASTPELVVFFGDTRSGQPDGAYLAAYLTDAKGAYVRTLWVAGGKAKYHKHLSDWSRLSAGDAKRLDGVTGASVGAGRTLKVTADLADALIDAGYEIRIDAAAEDMRDSPSEVRLPLSTANVGKPQAGKQYIQSVAFQLQ